MNFQPMEFVHNLYYMGFGMLGILIIMGVIIIASMILNRLGSGKKSSDSED